MAAEVNDIKSTVRSGEIKPAELQVLAQRYASPGSGVGLSARACSNQVDGA
jgi:hypothetical protein